MLKRPLSTLHNTISQILASYHSKKFQNVIIKRNTVREALLCRQQTCHCKLASLGSDAKFSSDVTHAYTAANNIVIVTSSSQETITQAAPHCACLMTFTDGKKIRNDNSRYISIDPTYDVHKPLLPQRSTPHIKSCAQLSERERESTHLSIQESTLGYMYTNKYQSIVNT